MTGVQTCALPISYLSLSLPPRCERLDVVEQAQQTFGLKPVLPDFYNILLERPRYCAAQLSYVTARTVRNSLCSTLQHVSLLICILWFFIWILLPSTNYSPCSANNVPPLPTSSSPLLLTSSSPLLLISSSPHLLFSSPSHPLTAMYAFTDKIRMGTAYCT